MGNFSYEPKSILLVDEYKSGQLNIKIWQTKTFHQNVISCFLVIFSNNRTQMMIFHYLTILTVPHSLPMALVCLYGYSLEFFIFHHSDSL
jgi:hypothetical protein